MRDENEEAVQPLMDDERVEDGDGERDRSGNGDRRDENAETTTAAVATATATKEESSRFIWMLTLTACLSGLLFGYDTGIISSTLLTLHTSLGHIPTTFDLSIITSSTSLAALIASPTAGWLADSMGRKAVIAIACGGFVLGAFMQAGAGSVAAMVAGRAVVGAAVGGASGVVPLYISEIAPSSRRGQLVTTQSLFITGGQVLAYILGFLSFGHWRYAVGFGAVPAILQAVLLVSLPESPRWLLLKGHEDAARDILLKLGQTEYEVEVIVEHLHHEIKIENLSGKSKFKDLFTVPANRKALGIACGLQAFQQLSGFNSLMYFSATIFALVGFTSPIGVSLCVALTNFFATLFAFNLIDRIGRRRILLWSIPWMVVGLTLCAIAFGFINTSAPAAVVVHVNYWPGILVAATVLYVAAYATGLGCVPWQQAELFNLGVRSVGSGLATATNWSSNFLVGATFLPMMGALGARGTFGVYAGICAVGWVWVWWGYPELGGRGLEGNGPTGVENDGDAED